MKESPPPPRTQPITAYLLKRAVAGNSAAFHVLEKHIRQVASRTLGHGSADIADVVQVTLLKIFQAAQEDKFMSLDPESSVQRFITVAAVNSAIDYKYRTKRINRIQAVELDDYVANSVTSTDSPANFEDREYIEAILESADLTKRAQAIFLMRYLQEYSPDEIAQIMSLPVGTVKSTLSRTLNALNVARRKL